MTTDSVADRRRGVRIHPLAEAVNIVDTEFANGGFEVPDDPRTAELWGQVTGSDGGILGMVLYGQSAAAGDFSLVHVSVKPNCPTPLHSHDVDCLYYIISGELTFGRNRQLYAGDSFFAPAHAPYQYTAGPEGVEVLEIRHGATQISTKALRLSSAEVERMEGAVRANLPAWKDAAPCSTFVSNPAAPETSPEHDGVPSQLVE